MAWYLRFEVIAHRTSYQLDFNRDNQVPLEVNVLYLNYLFSIWTSHQLNCFLDHWVLSRYLEHFVQRACQILYTCSFTMIDQDPPELGFKSINVSNRLIIIAMTAKSFNFLHLAIDCDSLATYENFSSPFLYIPAWCTSGLIRCQN